jgi:hypothetical protein
VFRFVDGRRKASVVPTTSPSGEVPARSKRADARVEHLYAIADGEVIPEGGEPEVVFCLQSEIVILSSAGQAGSLVEPAGAGLVASSPQVPVQVVVQAVPGAGEEVDQPFHLSDGQRDQAGIGGWEVLVAGGWRWGAAGSCAGSGGGNGADGQSGQSGQSGHGQHQVPKQRRIRADL